MILTEQILYLAICIYHEGRGEPKEGQVAIAHVVMNRVRKAGKSIRETVLRPWQFSWANGANRPAIKDYAALIECTDSAIQCLSERVEGKDLFGADHYFADYIEEPKWVERMTFVKQIGRHKFYRDA